MIEGALHNLYAEKEPIRSEAIKDTVDWIVARIWENDVELGNISEAIKDTVDWIVARIWENYVEVRIWENEADFVETLEIKLHETISQLNVFAQINLVCKQKPDRVTLCS